MMKHVHFIGIGGTGLSAIARVLLEQGVTVSGSDRVLSPMAQDLAKSGVKVFSGHDAANIAGADTVVRSSAVPDSNPEVQAAISAGIPVYKRSEFMGKLLAEKDVIAIAGTHGKTTTTAMMAWVLTCLYQDPSYIVGGLMKNLGSNAHAGTGNFFVIEADEYDRMFLGLDPRWIVLTNLEHDHPDCFPSPADYRQAFADFIHRLQTGGTLVVCHDHEPALALSSEVPSGCKILTYGMHPKATYRAVGVQPNMQGGFSFILRYQPPSMPSQPLRVVNLRIPGEHNVVNALGVLAVVHEIGLPLDKAMKALESFDGTGRRFDVQGEVGGITVIDDYAHHPTEIRTTLDAARSRYPNHRIWAVWQPHTYSRTMTLRWDFGRSFSNANFVIVTEIYAAREQNPGFSSAEIVAEMPHPAAHFSPNFQETTDYLLDHLQPGDVLLVLSAGDADQISSQVLDSLRKKEEQHG